MPWATVVIGRLYGVAGQDIIDPRETRAKLCDFVEDAQSVLRSQLGMTAAPYRP